METRLLNRKDLTPDFLPALEHADWTIVNAPRPLAGDATWGGLFSNAPFLSGRFYAAGPLEEYGKSWEEDHAVIVKLVTNEELEAQMRAMFAPGGKHHSEFTFEQVLEWYDNSLESMARMANLPWRK